VDPGILHDALTRIFVEQKASGGTSPEQDGAWSEGIWKVLHETGLAWIGVGEDKGGSGGGLEDVCLLVRLAGRYGVPLPIAEFGLLGGWLLDRAGVQLPSGTLSVPVFRQEDEMTLKNGRVQGRMNWVPWGSKVSAVAVIADSPQGPFVVLLDPNSAKTHPGTNLAGEHRDQLYFDNVKLDIDRIGSVDHFVLPELKLRGALSRALLMAGAMESVMEITIGYANQRVQFGRPVSSFQAIGNRLAQMCSEIESSVLVSEFAASRFAEIGRDAAFDVAAAKSHLSRAASSVAQHAHQIHGAVGTTEEYSLQRFTRRLWAWRQEWGSERVNSEKLGSLASQMGTSKLWQRVTEGLNSQ